jgi:hypothetical protein
MYFASGCLLYRLRLYPLNLDRVMPVREEQPDFDFFKTGAHISRLTIRHGRKHASGFVSHIPT